jgi:hypothetical protein
VEAPDILNVVNGDGILPAVDVPTAMKYGVDIGVAVMFIVNTPTLFEADTKQVPISVIRLTVSFASIRYSIIAPICCPELIVMLNIGITVPDTLLNGTVTYVKIRFMTPTANDGPPRALLYIPVFVLLVNPNVGAPFVPAEPICTPVATTFGTVSVVVAVLNVILLMPTVPVPL